MSQPDQTPFNNATRNRYEMTVEGHAVFLEYRRTGNIISLTHAETPPELRGRGLAAIVTKFALDDIRAQGLRANPLCPYVVSYIAKHTEYQDLVA